MNVRSATVDDAARIAEIHVRAWQVAYRGLVPDDVLDSLSLAQRSEFWKARLTRDPTTVLVATRDEEIVGWLAYGPARDENANPTIAEVYGLYVDPVAWRLGAGSKLWSEARPRMTTDGFSSAWLWVLEDNSRARSFYESCGFHLEIGPTKVFTKGGIELPEVRYRWNGS